mmetsp:Transcript_13648/g.29273  ORF Transcript_13648/g.29273 Transcript_13648/m.29273 type:complete len:335 (-) Transcript_13648:673-1677(-)
MALAQRNQRVQCAGARASLLKPAPIVHRARPFSAAFQPTASKSHVSACSSHVRLQSRKQLERGVYVIVRAEANTTAGAERPPEEADFDLLSTKIADLTKDINEELRGCSIYLVGMMGSGKSTLGKMLANTLKYGHFDTDTMIELTHDKKPVAEIFKEFGQDYFRDCETQVIKELAPYKRLVVSTGGGAVLRPKNWSYMQQSIVVWLNGPVELLARRVAKDGLEKRPLLAGDGANQDNLYDKALDKLKTLLEERTKYYENADLVVPLEGYGEDEEKGAPTAVVMYRLLQSLDKKIKDTKKEREEKRNFTIENADQLKTMRVVQSQNPEQQEEGGL